MHDKHKLNETYIELKIREYKSSNLDLKFAHSIRNSKNRLKSFHKHDDRLRDSKNRIKSLSDDNHYDKISLTIKNSKEMDWVLFHVRLKNHFHFIQLCVIRSVSIHDVLPRERYLKEQLPSFAIIPGRWKFQESDRVDMISSLGALSPASL